MKHNNLFYFHQEICVSWSEDQIQKHIDVVMNEIGSAYSVIILSDRSNNDRYRIRYAVSETEKYNTVSKKNVVDKIASCIAQPSILGKMVVGYIQPPVDLMVELYDPLIHKLATKQHRCWQQIEYEDLCQMCRMTLVLLYNKGYYIHKSLLEKAFENEVLQEMRKISSDVKFVSFETHEGGGEDMEKLTLGDTICDTDLENKKQDEESIQISNEIFNEVKSILIDIIGERQFEQLFRDYANGHTSTWSRRKMQTIKAIFEKEGLTRKLFNNKYGR